MDKKPNQAFQYCMYSLERNSPNLLVENKLVRLERWKWGKGQNRVKPLDKKWE